MSRLGSFQPLENEKSHFTLKFRLSKIWINEAPKTPLGDLWKPNYTVLPEKHLHFMEEIKNFEVRPDDIWMVAFPKSGITWAQEMVWLINHNLDFHTARSVKQKIRCPFFELSSLNDDSTDRKEIKAMIDVVNERSSPRNIKTHLPLGFLPEKLWAVRPKIVYLYRDPKDVAVSYYHQYKNIHDFQGTLEDFLDLFLDGSVAYSPYESHVKDFLELRGEHNVLFLNYEDMKADLKFSIQKTATFFNKILEPEQVDQLYEHLQPDQMRINVAVNQEEVASKGSARWAGITREHGLIRKAQVGSHKDEMSAEYIEKFTAFIRDRLPGLIKY